MSDLQPKDTESEVQGTEETTPAAQEKEEVQEQQSGDLPPITDNNKTTTEKPEKKTHFQTEPEAKKEAKKEPEPIKKKEPEPKREAAPAARKSETQESKRPSTESDGGRGRRSLTTPRTPRSEGGSEGGRRNQKEFFKLELLRLEGSLQRESSKIKKPTSKPYTPYTFNDLKPYYNTYTTRYLIHLPDEVQHGNVSRRTAQGLTDPWLDLTMDRDLLPSVGSKPVSRQVAILKQQKEMRERKRRSAAASSTSRREGSTRLPKFPVVTMDTQELATKQLFYSDVPALRQELKTKYSSSAKSKVDEDYKRTHADFYRMELDKLDEVHPINRGNMKMTYNAYLQNTPGSKKAVKECLRSLHSGKV